MRETARLTVDPITFHMGRSGAVTGEITLTADSIVFPEKNWNDFPAMVLCWATERWMDAEKGRGRLQIEFVDGDMRVDLIFGNDDELLLTPLENGVRLGTIKTQRSTFKSSLFDSGKQALTRILQLEERGAPVTAKYCRELNAALLRFSEGQKES